MTVVVDNDFVLIMQMHNQQALEMVQIEIDQVKSIEIKEMAIKYYIGTKKWRS